MLLRPTLTRPLLRLPSVLFPGQAVSLLRAASELQDSAVQHPFSVPEGMLAVARAEGDGACSCPARAWRATQLPGWYQPW